MWWTWTGMGEFLLRGDRFNLSDAPSVLSTSVFWEGAHFHQWSERHLDLCATSTQPEKTNISHLSFPDCHDRTVVIIACCRLIISFTHSLTKLFGLGFRNNNYTTAFKCSLQHQQQQQQPHSLNRDWWQQPAAISWRLVFHWSNCINQGCLQREHSDQRWITAGNYASASKHHTCNVWCAVMKIIHNPGYLYTS